VHVSIPSKYVWRGIIVSMFMMVGLLWLPPTLRLLSEGYGLSNGQLGRLATAELLGMLIGTTAGSNRPLAALKNTVLLAAACMVVLHGAVALGAPISVLAILMLLAGCGSGLGYALGLKLCGASERPTRMFGLIHASLAVMSMLGFQFISRLHSSTSAAHWAQSHGGLGRAVFAFYALLAALSFVILTRMRLPSIRSSEASTEERRGLPRPLEITGLLSIAASFTGYGAVWTFLPLIGAAYGLSDSGIANATSMFAFMMLLGSVSSGLVPETLPRWALGVALFILVACGLYGLFGAGTLLAYTVGCILCGFYWAFNLPVVLGTLAELDKTGRASVLGGAMSAAGGALGPLIAGLLLKGTDYQPIAWLAGTLCALAFVFHLILESRSKVLRVEMAH
jgi:predicted MFS family arabinose efflux permease